MRAILVSFQPKYAELLLSGEKKIEFRKKFAAIEPGTSVAMYSSSPACAIVGVLKVEGVSVLPLDELWRLAKGVPGESREEFDSYYEGCETGSAIFVSGVRRVRPISLDEMRAKYDIEPPMSWRYLPPGMERRLFSRGSK